MSINRRSFLSGSIAAGFGLTAAKSIGQADERIPAEPVYDGWLVEVFGIAQDAGVPQLGCICDHCRYYAERRKQLYPACLALIHPQSKSIYLFDATPDIRAQLNIDRVLKGIPGGPFPSVSKPNGIFLTHAHMGHYTGLMHYGFEAMNAKELNVICSEKMAEYLSNNGPWSQLVKYKNIFLHRIKPGEPFDLLTGCTVTAFTVPHRQEYTDTLGFSIQGPNKSVLYIPDIDKWEDWEKSIIDEIRSHDISFIDGTFFSGGELPGRDMSAVPHPTVQSTIKLLQGKVNLQKNEVYFVHFNHSNPLVMEDSNGREFVISSGFKVADQGDVINI